MRQEGRTMNHLFSAIIFQVNRFSHNFPCKSGPTIDKLSKINNKKEKTTDHDGIKTKELSIIYQQKMYKNSAKRNNGIQIMRA